jgi:hypothetical protein
VAFLLSSSRLFRDSFLPFNRHRRRLTFPIFWRDQVAAPSYVVPPVFVRQSTVLSSQRSPILTYKRFYFQAFAFRRTFSQSSSIESFESQSALPIVRVKYSHNNQRDNVKQSFTDSLCTLEFSDIHQEVLQDRLSCFLTQCLTIARTFCTTSEQISSIYSHFRDV